MIQTSRRVDGGRSNRWLKTKKGVENWQMMLVAAGFPLKVDGDYGPLTTRATGDLQGMTTYRKKANGYLLSVDGDAGPSTISVAVEMMNDGWMISENFRVRELSCHCSFPWPDGSRVIISKLELGRSLSPSRLGYQPGVHIISGHRTSGLGHEHGSNHNAAVGGASGSFHTCHPAGTERHDWCETSAVDIGNWRELKWTHSFCRDTLKMTGGLGIHDATGWAIHHDDGPWRDWRYFD